LAKVIYSSIVRYPLTSSLQSYNLNYNKSSLAIVFWSLKGWNDDLGTSSTIVQVDIDYAKDLELILIMPVVKYNPDDKSAEQFELYYKMDILLLFRIL